MTPDDFLEPAAIRAAAARLAPHIRRTPVIEVDGGDFGLDGVRLAFKLEFLQHAGSFKTRGAFNNLLQRRVPAAGVVAASGGNHGAAVAYASMKRGVPATIFVPSVASPAKMEQIRGYGHVKDDHLAKVRGRWAEIDKIITGETYSQARRVA